MLKKYLALALHSIYLGLRKVHIIHNLKHRLVGCVLTENVMSNSRIVHKYDILKILTSDSQSKISVSSSKRTEQRFNKLSKSLSLCICPPPTHRGVRGHGHFDREQTESYRHLRAGLTCICTALCVLVFNKHGCTWGIQVYCNVSSCFLDLQI